MPARDRVLVEQTVVRNAGQFRSAPEDFREAGFECERCSWATKKRAFAGRQALRAHLKKHVRERRSVVRPLAVQLLVTALAVAAYLGAPALQGSLASEDSGIWLRLQPHIPAQPVMSAGAVAIPALLVLAHWAGAARFMTTGRRRMDCLVRVTLIINSASLPCAALLAGLPVAFVWPGWLSGFALVAMSNMLLAPLTSRARIDMARRRFQPSGYAPLFRAVSSEVEEKLLAFRERIKRYIHEGSIEPATLNRAQKRLLDALGLGHVRPKAEYVEARERREQRERRRRV